MYNWDAVITVLLTLVGIWLMFIGSWWWALLAFFLAMSIPGTLIIGFFVGLVFFLWMLV